LGLTMPVVIAVWFLFTLLLAGGPTLKTRLCEPKFQGIYFMRLPWAEREFIGRGQTMVLEAGVPSMDSGQARRNGMWAFQNSLWNLFIYLRAAEWGTPWSVTSRFVQVSRYAAVNCFCSSS
jgi:hypothetical protein